MSERPLAIGLAHQILHSSDAQERALAPLARDYLKALGELDFMTGTPHNLEMAREVDASEKPADFEKAFVARRLWRGS